MTVIEYESKFFHLSKYAWEQLKLEAGMCTRFDLGLNKNIRAMVGALTVK